MQPYVDSAIVQQIYAAVGATVGKPRGGESKSSQSGSRGGESKHSGGSHGAGARHGGRGEEEDEELDEDIAEELEDESERLSPVNKGRPGMRGPATSYGSGSSRK